MIKFFIISFVAISIICPIFNYAYLFLATKFGFHKGFMRWVMNNDGEDFIFFAPLFSLVTTLIFMGYIFYNSVYRPTFYLIFELPLKGFVWLADILMKPIKKNQFKNELEDLAC